MYPPQPPQHYHQQQPPQQKYQQHIQQSQPSGQFQPPPQHYQPPPQPQPQQYQQNVQQSQPSGQFQPVPYRIPAPPQQQYQQNVQQSQPSGQFQQPPQHYQPPPPPQQQQQQQYQQHIQQTQSSGQFQPPSMHHQHLPPPQQSRELDPNLMPSVTDVIQEDIAKLSEENIISTRPLSVPPLVTTLKDPETKVSMQDGGCARPNHIRSTFYSIPNSEDLLKTTGLPFGIVVTPFAEEELDETINVPVSESEIIRCNRCKAYMSPFMRFIDGGRRFQCALCRHISEVPNTYFAHLDHNGRRLDEIERPELNLGSYEFRGTAEYCRNGILNCRRPHIIFAFEMTVNSKLLVHQLSKHLPDVIKNHLPTDIQNPGSRPPLVGFLTYNSKIQVYDIINNNQVRIVSDVAETFSPSTTFLVDPVTHADQIERFLQSLPSLYNDNELETETILGPVIEAALQSCQVDKNNWFIDPETGSNATPDPSKVVPAGKVYLFHCTLPTYGRDNETPGRLKIRWNPSNQDDARRLLGTDKEKNILTPEPSKHYTNFASRCVTQYGSGVELFLFPPVNGPYLDLATISELVRLTGSGGIYKYYNDFSDRFVTDLKYSLKSSFAFDTVMKVRTSTGVRPFEYFGNFYSRSTSDIESAVVNAEASIVVEFRYDDKLPEDEYVVIQTATLYTSISGERRIRVHNAAFGVCDEAAVVYKSCCCDTIMNLFLRSGVSQLKNGTKTPQQIKEHLISRCVAILSSYRKHCASPGSPLGQLILPEALKLLPIYTIGAFKCDAINGGAELSPDEKAYAQIVTLGASIDLTQVILYPKLLCIEYDPNYEGNLRAVHIRCSSVRLDNNSAMAYLLETGFHYFLYLPTSLPNTKNQQFLWNVFGVDSLQKVPVETELPNLMTMESQFIKTLIEKMSKRRRRAIKLHIIRQGLDKTEIVFKSFLYEDKKGHDSVGHDALSYVDFLCHLHKEIRAQLNN